MRKQLSVLLLCALLFACNLPNKMSKTEPTVTDAESTLARYTEDTCIAAKIAYAEATYKLTLELKNVSAEYYPEDKVYLKLNAAIDEEFDKIIYHVDPAELIPLTLALNGIGKFMPCPSFLPCISTNAQVI